MNNMLTDAGLIDKAAAEMRSKIKMDNKGSIDLASGDGITKRSKHIEVRYHLIRDLVKKKEISLSYVDSKSNAADGLTKPLARPRFVDFRSSIGITRVA